MKEQNLKNHARFVIGYHVISFVAILALLIGSFINLAHSAKENLYSASLICLIAVILGLFFVFIRTFPLKAQDRAIRAEENLRHFILTGKPLSDKLTINQIIALRFASDAEYLDLVTKAIEQNLAPKQIKESIKKWRADHHRA